MISNEDAVFDAACEANAAGRTLIFDLDNTLYDEAHYLARAYRGFVDGLAPELGFDADVATAFLLDGLKGGRRSVLLQDFAGAFGVDMAVARDALFQHLRERPLGEMLALYPWANRFLDCDPDIARLAIVTNGNPAQQANKIAHLPRLAAFFPTQIIFANLHGGKPLPGPARALGQVMPLIDPLYIGDSDSDATFAAAAGFDFFRADYLTG